MKYRKMVLMNLFAGQDIEKGLVNTAGKEEGGMN